MVVVDSSMPLIFLSSTNAGAAGAPLLRKTPPLPPSPWQRAHSSAKIAPPRSAVPLPAGTGATGFDVDIPLRQIGRSDRLSEVRAFPLRVANGESHGTR